MERNYSYTTSTDVVRRPELTTSECGGELRRVSCSRQVLTPIRAAIAGCGGAVPKFLGSCFPSSANGNMSGTLALFGALGGWLRSEFSKGWGRWRLKRLRPGRRRQF